MHFKYEKTLVIDPTRPQKDQLFFTMCLDKKFLYEFKNLPIPGKRDFDEEQSVTFTHPSFTFTKPKRISKKGVEKPEGTYICVFEPQAFGEGSFGAVYPIVGTWKKVDSSWIYKPKTNTLNPRIVKTNAYTKNYPRHYGSSVDQMSIGEILESYKIEQSMGQYVPYIGLEYPVQIYDDIAVLLMRKQSGVELTSIIEQLHSDPNFLTIANKLRITISLIHQLNLINEITVPASDNSKKVTMAHNDIKPGNIMVDEKHATRFIDFGLASPMGLIDALVGTPSYMDPKKFIGKKNSTDRVTEFASLSRVIAELWGDRSNDNLVTTVDLVLRNKKNILTDLLKGIEGLTEQENRALRVLISAMNHYEENTRVSREDALMMFKSLLKIRLKEDIKLVNRLINTELSALGFNELFTILSSSKAASFLKKFDKDPGSFIKVINILKSALFKLDESVLQLINQSYFNFSSSPNLIFNLLKNNLLTVPLLNTLKNMKVPVGENCLEYWVNTKSDYGQELEWAKMCRALVESTPNAGRFFEAIEEKNSFKYLYYTHFLANPEATTNDQSNVRLIQRHLSIYRDSLFFIRAVTEELDLNFNDTKFAAAILKSDLMNASKNKLVLIRSDVLIDMLTHLKHMHFICKKVQKLQDIEGLKSRNKQVAILKQQSQDLFDIEDDNWMTVFKRSRELESRATLIENIDQMHAKCLKKKMPFEIEGFAEEIAGCYSMPVESATLLMQKFKWLFLAADECNAVELIRQRMRFSKGCYLSEAYEAFKSEATIKFANDFHFKMKCYHELFELHEILVSQLTAPKNDFETIKILTGELLDPICDKLKIVLPANKASLCMMQISEMTKTKLNQIRIMSSSDNYSCGFFLNSPKCIKAAPNKSGDFTRGPST